LEQVRVGYRTANDSCANYAKDLQKCVENIIPSVVRKREVRIEGQQSVWFGKRDGFLGMLAVSADRDLFLRMNKKKRLILFASLEVAGEQKRRGPSVFPLDRDPQILAASRTVPMSQATVKFQKANRLKLSLPAESASGDLDEARVSICFS
jgi:hypothetical protein